MGLPPAPTLFMCTLLCRGFQSLVASISGSQRFYPEKNDNLLAFFLELGYIFYH